MPLLTKIFQILVSCIFITLAPLLCLESILKFSLILPIGPQLYRITFIIMFVLKYKKLYFIVSNNMCLLRWDLLISFPSTLSRFGGLFQSVSEILLESVFNLASIVDNWDIWMFLYFNICLSSTWICNLCFSCFCLQWYIFWIFTFNFCFTNTSLHCCLALPLTFKQLSLTWKIL